MKTKLLTMLLGGLAASFLAVVAQNSPAPAGQGQTPAAAPQAQGAAAETAAPAPAEPPAEVLPLVQFEDAPLVDVIKTLARQAALNVIFDPRVTQVDQTGKSPYPVERTLLTSILHDFAMRSAAEGGTTMSDPAMKVVYQPANESYFFRGPFSDE